MRAFHARLCDIRVLDPACGSGNFLYVALEMMKRLEGETDIIKSFNGWPRCEKNYPQADVQYPQSARRLSDGSGVFYLRSKSPFQFLDEYPARFRFASHGGSPPHTLPLAAWFHWQLRNRNMLM